MSIVRREGAKGTGLDRIGQDWTGLNIIDGRARVDGRKSPRRLKRKVVLVSIVTFLALLAITIALLVYFLSGKTRGCEEINVSPSPLGKYAKAAVSTNGQECSRIGADILWKNGSAVDAAIAALLCEGVASLHSMGLGGGFLMTIWDAKGNVADYLDARETAPQAAHEDMFGGDAKLSMYGGLSVAVPGEILGYWEAHKKYGKLKWHTLFEPAIDLCRTGSVINHYLGEYLKSKEAQIRAEPSLADILINPATNTTWKTGERIKRFRLANTLESLAVYGPAIFYNGTMADDLVREIQGFKGIITKEDFMGYRVKWRKPVILKVGSFTIYTAPPPGSGIILSFIMNILHKMLPVNDEGVMWQRVVETFKWAYARRTQLGDPDFVNIESVLANLTSASYAEKIRGMIEDDQTSQDPGHYDAVTVTSEDSGTAHVSVLAPDGSAVSVTSTINQVFGAMIRSRSTGIIFNDEMDDFSSPNITNGFGLPPSPANFIRPGKRPLSSMAPTIVVDDQNRARLIIGAAGGTKITTGIAIAMILNLWVGWDVKESIDALRLHHQLLPMYVQNEKNFCPSVLDSLREIGHDVTTFSGIGSAITAVACQDGIVTANSDYRRQGTTSGF